MNDSSVLWLSIDLPVTVAMVTDNGRSEYKKMTFWTKIWRFYRKVNIEHKQIPKGSFKYMINITKMHTIIK